MRLFVIWLIGLVIGVVGGFVLAHNFARSTGAASPAGAFSAGAFSECADRIERAVAFTAPEAQDVLIIQSSGPSCANVVATVTLRSADGRILFAHAQRIDALMDPKLNPVAVNGIRAVLNDYAALAEGGAKTALPDWADNAGEPAAPAPYAAFTPTSSNLLYRRVREANAPILRLREGRDSGAFFAYLPEIDEVEQLGRYSL